MSGRGSSYVNDCGHIDRPHYGNNLCAQCYHRKLRLERNPNAVIYKRRTGNAACHPDRSMWRGDGLCHSCCGLELKYNITNDQVVSMYQAQDGRCKLCLKSFDRDDLYVEHDHVTNKVRGLVCPRCNIIIGCAEDPLIERAIAYIEDNS